MHNMADNGPDSSAAAAAVGGTNDSRPAVGPAFPHAHSWPVGALICVLVPVPDSVSALVVLIVAGNSLVLLAVVGQRRLRQRRSNWLIASLAAADLLVGLLIMPLSAVYEVLGTWIMGRVLCELWLALDVLFVTSSILNLCSISLDRYFSVTEPLSYPHKRTARRMSLMIASAWLISLGISLPPIVGWRPARRDSGECALSTDMGYVLYSATGSFWLPVAVLVAAYSRIYSVSTRQLRSRLKETQRTADVLTQHRITDNVDEDSRCQSRTL